MAKQAALGEEVWTNTLGGRLHYFTTDENGKRRNHVARSGQTIRISTYDRELIGDEAASPKRDPFLNGHLKRVDDRILTADTPPEEAAGKTPLPEGHQADQANDSADLLLLLKKNGMAFQTAIKGLDERNVRQIKALIETDSDAATVSQAAFVEKHIEENFKLGGPTSSGVELLNEPS